MTGAFLLTSLVIVATPGTGAIYTIHVGLTRGRRASVLAAAACTLGIVPHLLVAVLGLAALLETGTLAYTAVRWAGIGFLLFMAWAAWRDRGTGLVDALRAGPGAHVPVRRIWRDAVVLNLLNPKLTIFFLGFLPQFVGAEEGRAAMVVLGAVFMAMTLVVFAAYGLAGTTLRPLLRGHPVAVAHANKAFALLYVALAAALAISS